MRSYHIIILILILSAGGCGDKKDTVVSIGSKSLTIKDIDARMSKLPERYKEIVKVNRKDFVDDIVMDELLYAEALRTGVDSEKEVKEVIEEAKKKIVIAKYLKDHIEDKVKADDVEIRSYYDSNLDEFKTPEVLRASHIMLRSEDEARSVSESLRAGSDFAKLAESRSIDSLAGAGGDIGYFVRGQVDPEFEKVAVNLREGEISGVVKTRSGYHIIKLTERKNPSYESYDAVKDRIKQGILAAKKKKVFNDLVSELKKKYKVTVNYDLLPGKALNETEKSSNKENGSKK